MDDLPGGDDTVYTGLVTFKTGFVFPAIQVTREKLHPPVLRSGLATFRKAGESVTTF